MTSNTVKIAQISLSLLFLQATQAPEASANDMVNNNAFGLVAGNIIQKVKKGGHNEINVGAIVAENGARGVKTKAFVIGNIRVKGNTTLNVGSYID